MKVRFLHRQYRKAAVALGGLVRSYPWGDARIVNVPGFFTEGDVARYRELCRAVPPKGLVVEIGSWKGRSILNAAVAAPQVRFVAVDTFLGAKHERDDAHAEATRTPLGVYPVFLRNLLRTRIGNVSVLRLPSVEAAAFVADRTADLVFIDAGHSEPEVLEDLAAWRSKVKPGGTLAGHDLHGDDNDVARALYATFRRDEILRAEGTSIWAVRM